MKPLKILIFLLIFNTFVLLGYLVSEADITGNVIYEKIKINISQVIDGDTVNSSIGRIRLLGINTKMLE